MVTNLLRFGAIFSCISIFRPFSFPPHSLPTSPLSHFSSPLPLPKEVNKKLIYRGPTALSVIKHECNNDSDDIMYLSIR